MDYLPNLAFSPETKHLSFVFHASSLCVILARFEGLIEIGFVIAEEILIETSSAS